MSEQVEFPEISKGFLLSGLVQGVGFRPLLKRWAHERSLVGYTRNTPLGVEVGVWGRTVDVEDFERALMHSPPALARIDHIETFSVNRSRPNSFEAETSVLNGSHALAIAADVATCDECFAEILNPLAHRFRYPFTNCTNCGPRFSIIRGMPYDRERTAMANFAMCEVCQSEYGDLQDRRNHAQPIACFKCGPQAALRRLDGHAICVESFTQTDEVDAVCSLLKAGAIVAIKGIGGFNLACDATNSNVVMRLRDCKQRPHKPLAMMARDLNVIRRYVTCSLQEEALLRSKEAPIVVMAAHCEPPQTLPLAASVAPGQRSLGFMLPYTPLHALIMKRMDRPVVFTSGNLSNEPQCIDAAAVVGRLSSIAEYIVDHNRPIERRIDDSVVRVIAEQPRVLRRARGYAPASIPLPRGFAAPPAILSLGGDLKNTFGLLSSTGAVVSHHIGDLSNPHTRDDFSKAIADLECLLSITPQVIAADSHPDYYSRRCAVDIAAKRALPIVEVQHHHAHVASCLFENGYERTGKPVLGVVLDGLGFWDGELCGGEFVRANYEVCQRIGTFKPVALPGGEKAMQEPWRNTFAHLLAESSWSALQMNFADLELMQFMHQHTDLIEVIESKHTPKASSAGRLFDAVAAALNIRRQAISYEGQAAMELEAMIDQDVLHHEDAVLAYPFAIPTLAGSGLPYIEPLAMWQALLGDLILDESPGTIAARFHKGLAVAIVRMVTTLSGQEFTQLPTVVLSGGVWQNKTLTELVVEKLRERGFAVLQHSKVPMNDGGLALGQAAVAVASQDQMTRRSDICA